jgi:hypothetical protein
MASEQGLGKANSIELPDELLEKRADWAVWDYIKELQRQIRELTSEVHCRTGHGAESGGHLEYVQGKLDELLSFARGSL